MDRAGLGVVRTGRRWMDEWKTFSEVMHSLYTCRFLSSQHHAHHPSIHPSTYKATSSQRPISPSSHRLTSSLHSHPTRQTGTNAVTDVLHAHARILPCTSDKNGVCALLGLPRSCRSPSAKNPLLADAISQVPVSSSPPGCVDTALSTKRRPDWLDEYSRAAVHQRHALLTAD